MITETLNELIERIYLADKEINNKVIEMEEVSKMILLTLFSKNHLFLIGTPGVGKTYIFEIVSTIIEDGSTFDICIKDDTKYSEIFGEKIKDENDRITVDLSGTIVQSHIAIIDEIWKGNSKVINSLLSITSGYRTAFIDGVGKVMSPLISAFAASNEMPQDKSLEALADRFVIKMVVNRIQDDTNWKKFIKKDYDTDPNLTTKFLPNEIDLIYTKAQTDVEIPETILDIMLNIKNQAVVEKLKMSDRRFGFATSLIKTSAFINRRMIVNRSDLFILKYIMWSDLDEIDQVSLIISNEIFGRKDEIKKLINESYDKLDEVKSVEKGELSSFKNHRRYFSQENEREFVYYYNLFVKNLERKIKAFNTLVIVVDSYNKMIEIEKEIRENYFIENYNSDLFESINIKELGENFVKVEQEIKNDKNWLNDNDKIFKYNNGVNKKRES